MVTRCLRLGLRNVDGLITALALPVMLMLIFVYLFGGALHTGTSYVNYVVPGVLLVCLGFGTGTTAVTVAHDMTGSIIDRLRSMNTPATSLITGHVVAGTLRNLISTKLVFGRELAKSTGITRPSGICSKIQPTKTLLANDIRNRREIMQPFDVAKQDVRPDA